MLKSTVEMTENENIDIGESSVMKQSVSQVFFFGMDENFVVYLNLRHRISRRRLSCRCAISITVENYMIHTDTIS